MIPAGRALALLALWALSQEKPAKPWTEMDYGPTLSASIQAAPGNIACKGIAIRLDGGEGGVARGREFMLFDTDTLAWAAGWTGGFIDWKGIAYDGSHQTHPSIAGRLVFSNPAGPGWDEPGPHAFEERRLLGRDGRPYGPLRRDHGRWKGLYVHGDRVVLSYRVGETGVLESPGRERGGLTRTLNVGPREKALLLQVAFHPGHVLEVQGGPPRTILAGKEKALLAALKGGPEGAHFTFSDGHLRLSLPAGREAVRLKILYFDLTGAKDHGPVFEAVEKSEAPADLEPLTRGGPARWKERLETKPVALDPKDGAYVIESLILPGENPYRSWMRPGGFDFFRDGRRAAVCTWNGDVWIVDGLGGETLTWRRIAAGLFQPLGLRIVDEKVYVTCRDQIARLHDLNGDGETDFYESFNHDAQVTPHFHEFAMDLQTDAEGNFYYAKAARHALDAVVPQHGTLIKVSPDGSKSQIVCNGFRAPNGVGLGPRGEIALSDQEGHWVPANRISLVKPGGFYGNMFSYHRGERPSSYDPPVVWLPKNVDRSPAEQLWVASDRWGPFQGKMISLSYGMGQIFHVMYEERSGAAAAFPLLFPTGIMRGRFHPGDGQLYVCGLFGWSSNRTAAGGFYRVRYTGKAFPFPAAFRVRKGGIELCFTEPLDPASAADPESYAVQQWNYRWTEKYGSEHFRVSDPKKAGQDRVDVAGAELSKDGRTVFLKIPGVRPVMQMEISFSLRAADGAAVRQKVFATIHSVPE